VSLDDSVMEAYLAEAREHIAKAEETLLEIEEQGSDFDRELIDEVFRAVHTVKGGSAFYSLDNINTLSHETENVLSLLRSNKLNPTPFIMDNILKAIDKLKEFLNEPLTSNEADISSLIKELKKFSGGKEKEKTVKKENNEEKNIKEDGYYRLNFQYDKDKINPTNTLYLIRVDVNKDCKERERSILDIIDKANFVGEIISSDHSAEKIASGEINPEEVFFLYQSPLIISNLHIILSLPQDRISEWIEGKSNIIKIEKDKKEKEIKTIPKEKNSLEEETKEVKEEIPIKEEITLVLDSKLTIEKAGELKNKLLKTIESANNIKLDISNINEIDLSGIQLLCSAHRTCNNLNKKLSLTGKKNDIFNNTTKSAGYIFEHGCHWDENKTCLWIIK